LLQIGKVGHPGASKSFEILPKKGYLIGVHGWGVQAWGAGGDEFGACVLEQLLVCRLTATTHLLHLVPVPTHRSHSRYNHSCMVRLGDDSNPCAFQRDRQALPQCTTETGRPENLLNMSFTESRSKARTLGVPAGPYVSAHSSPSARIIVY